MATQTIFVVEDDADISFLITFLLKRAGYEVQKAADGFAASQYISSEPRPALVLLDIMLPFKDGFQLLHEIRTRKEWESTPVIMLSALAQSKDIARGLSEGANDYLVKPFQPDELLARVAKYTKQQS